MPGLHRSKVGLPDLPICSWVATATLGVVFLGRRYQRVLRGDVVLVSVNLPPCENSLH